MVTIRAAAAQIAPVFDSSEGTIDKVLETLDHAAAQGVELLVFPEALVPYYPYFAFVRPPVSAADEHLALYEDAVTLPGWAVDAVAAQARRHGIVTVLGVTEREHGSLYNTQLVFDADGMLLQRRRKLLPGFHERMVWGEGDATGLKVVDTAVGKVGTLASGEHYHPLARYALMTQHEQIHCAQFPGSMIGQLSSEQIDATIRHHAMEAGSFVISATGWLSEAQIASITPDSTLQRSLRGGCHTSIVSPEGVPLAPTLREGEGLVVADLDLSLIIRRKRMMDAVGHGGRPAMLSLAINDLPATPTVPMASAAWRPEAPLQVASPYDDAEAYDDEFDEADGLEAQDVPHEAPAPQPVRAVAAELEMPARGEARQGRRGADRDERADDRSGGGDGGRSHERRHGRDEGRGQGREHGHEARREGRGQEPRAHERHDERANERAYERGDERPYERANERSGEERAFERRPPRGDARHAADDEARRTAPSVDDTPAPLAQDARAPVQAELLDLPVVRVPVIEGDAATSPATPEEPPARARRRERGDRAPRGERQERGEQAERMETPDARTEQVQDGEGADAAPAGERGDARGTRRERSRTPRESREPREGRGRHERDAQLTAAVAVTTEAVAEVMTPDTPLLVSPVTTPEPLVEAVAVAPAVTPEVEAPTAAAEHVADDKVELAETSDTVAAEPASEAEAAQPEALAAPDDAKGLAADEPKDKPSDKTSARRSPVDGAAASQAAPSTADDAQRLPTT